MRLKKLFADEEAVSPVIGVILMVAITVILAAVIASVVLGVGQEAGSTSPTAAYSFDYDTSENGADGTWGGNLTVTHDSGDAIDHDDVYIRGTDFVQSSNNQSWVGYVGEGKASSSGSVSGGQTAVAAGDRAEFGANQTYEVNIIWEDPDGDSSATLSSDTGPEA